VPRTALLLTLTFLESAGTILVERAVYFYCHDRLGFTDTMNLWLALAFGVCYVAGALSSHRLSQRAGEWRVLGAALVAQVAGLSVLAVWPTAAVVFVGSVALGLLAGLKWPIVESYVSAGHGPARAAKAIGRFNVSWAAAVPIALALAGPLIAYRPWALFAAAGGISAVSLILMSGVPRRPPYLPHDHPERPDVAQTARLVHLLVGARWLMLASYSCLWILAALMPGLLAGLGYRAGAGTALSSVLDVARLSAFALLGAWTAWHGRRWPVAHSIVVLPIGFGLVLFGGSLPVVLAGEVLFGWAAGTTYFSALYYAMVVKNASVEGGGGHEGLIGLGFALGPAAGLIGVAMRPLFGAQHTGVVAVAGLLIALCAAASARSLLRARTAR